MSEKYERDLKAIHLQKTWLCKKIQEMRPTTPEEILMVVPPGILAEIYFKLKYDLKESETGFYEDFETGEDAKIGISNKIRTNYLGKNTTYRIKLSSVSKKRGVILALGFNRFANTVEEFRIPKEARDGIKSPHGLLEITYEMESNKPIGKYAKYRVETHNWNYTN